MVSYYGRYEPHHTAWNVQMHLKSTAHDVEIVIIFRG